MLNTIAHLKLFLGFSRRAGVNLSADEEIRASSRELLGSQRRRRGVIVSYANSIASVMVSLLYVPILLNGIGRDEYGLYQLVASIIA